MTRPARGLARSENGSVVRRSVGDTWGPPGACAGRAKALQQDLERARPVLLGAEQQSHQMSDFAVHSVSRSVARQSSTYRTVFRPDLPCRDARAPGSASARVSGELAQVM